LYDSGFIGKSDYENTYSQADFRVLKYLFAEGMYPFL
jgi:hypothetical protein